MLELAIRGNIVADWLLLGRALDVDPVKDAVNGVGHCQLDISSPLIEPFSAPTFQIFKNMQIKTQHLTDVKNAKIRKSYVLTKFSVCVMFGVKSRKKPPDGSGKQFLTTSEALFEVVVAGERGSQRLSFILLLICTDTARPDRRRPRVDVKRSTFRHSACLPYFKFPFFCKNTTTKFCAWAVLDEIFANVHQSR